MKLSSDSVWDALRAQMPVTAKWAYFDHAAVAPLSLPAQQALADWSQDVASSGDVNWTRWRKRIEEVRSIAATMIGADDAEIALIRNTTEGVNFVAEGYPWQPGDNVVTPSGEFPTNLYAWLNLESLGVEVRRIPTENERLDLQALRDACDSKTRIITVSWIGFATGWKNDLPTIAEIAHQAGALLFVDAIQGLGVFPLNVHDCDIDFLAADSHKWMLGPEGAGVFYIKQNHLDRLRPFGIGWNSVQNAGDYDHVDFTLTDSAARYEGGSYNMAGVHAMGASLSLLNGIGIDRITPRLLDVTNEICERIESIGGSIVSCRDEDRQSGIVAFNLSKGDHHEIRRRCLKHDVVLNVRAGRLRISPHAYTNSDDVDRLFDVLESR